MANGILAISGIFGALAVTLGAVGSHVLKGRLLDADYGVYELGVEYLLIHAVVLFGCGVYAHRDSASVCIKIAGGLLICGIVLFCGSLIGRAVLGIPSLGRVAPFGGAALILGWLSISAAGVANYWRTR